MGHTDGSPFHIHDGGHGHGQFDNIGPLAAPPATVTRREATMHCDTTKIVRESEEGERERERERERGMEV